MHDFFLCCLQELLCAISNTKCPFFLVYIQLKITFYHNETLCFDSEKYLLHLPSFGDGFIFCKHPPDGSREESCASVVSLQCEYWRMPEPSSFKHLYFNQYIHLCRLEISLLVEKQAECFDLKLSCQEEEFSCSRLKCE